MPSNPTAPPAVVPRWAELNDNGGTSGYGTPASNVVTPPSGNSDTGFADGTYPPAGWWNWFAMWTCNWILWLKSLTAQALTWTGAQTFSALSTFTGNLLATILGAQDVYIYRGLLLSKVYQPAGMPAPSLPIVGIPTPSTTYVSTVSIDANSSECEGNLKVTLTGTAFPTGVTALVIVYNGSNRPPHAICATPGYYNTGGVSAASTIEDVCTSKCGVTWAPLAGGGAGNWELQFINGSGSSFTPSAGSWVFDYIAAY